MSTIYLPKYFKIIVFVVTWIEQAEFDKNLASQAISAP
tara:strand:- start:108 stop:221 length:114 start_codon:yes stop_codon:yes gene_type:complete